MSAAKKVQIVSSLCKLSLLLLLSLLLSNFIPITKGIQIHNYSRSITMMNTGGITNAVRRLSSSTSVGKLKPENTVFLLCDIQDRFRPLTWRGETIINTAKYMTSVAKELDIPIVITQQYTKVFGETVKDTFADQEHFASCKIFEKKRFSMCTDEVKSHMQTLNRDSVVIFGIEAHVCVQQTCLDLLEDGKEVHIIADSVSSQQPYDRELALNRMSQAGAFLTTAQSAAFMLMQSAEHANFRAVSKLTVEHMKLPNEFNGDAYNN